MSIRLPSGVPGDVLASFRAASGRMYRPGQFLSYEKAFLLHDLLSDWLAAQEQEAAEWEVGIDYTEVNGYHHAHGARSDVTFNARVFRDDGGPLTAEDAVDALSEVAFSGSLPPGVSAQAVQWSRNQRAWRKGTEGDLAAFAAIIAHVGETGVTVRMGKVKQLHVLPASVSEWMRGLE